MRAGWTFGCEHEWADIPFNAPLPAGYGWDRRDITIVNSNGIANDPTGRYYRFGGEINTPPTDTPTDQMQCLKELKRLLPMARVNYRSNLHVHIRVPGLKEDLLLLKRVQQYIHSWMPAVFAIVESIERPTAQEYPDVEELQGALRRWRRRRVSHHTLLAPGRLRKQLEAKTLNQFFEWEVPADKYGKPQWQCQPRLCVSLRQLLQTDTVEFRHFPGTLDEVELANCVEWCTRFMERALAGKSLQFELIWAGLRKFPTFPPYQHWMERRYRATVHDGTVPKAQIAANIKAIEAGEFDDNN